jgi:hypothetical protein
VDFVFATTTLAEGVNFPFSTVIVQSLALKSHQKRGGQHDTILSLPESSGTSLAERVDPDMIVRGRLSCLNQAWAWRRLTMFLVTIWTPASHLSALCEVH